MQRSHQHRSIGRTRAGLTLVEVLMALTILSIGLFVLVAAASRCLAVARQAKHYEKARHLLARAELENALQFEEEVQEGSDSGSFSGEQGYSWSRDVRLISEEEEDGLFEVTWRVHWTDRRKAAKEEVVTYLHAPEVVEGGSFERAAP